MLLLLFFAFALVASSCGSSDDDTPAATEADASSSASSDEPAEEEEFPDLIDTVDPQMPEISLLENLDAKPIVGSDLLGDFDELVITDVIEGDGDEAVTGANVSMQYVGVLGRNGAQFDASWDRGAQPLDFVLGQGGVILGWDQGIEGMKVGGRRILQIPSALAYGDSPRGDIITADSDLVFIVDLVAVQPPPPPPEPAPPVPEDALGAFDELAIIELVEGTGDAVAVGDVIEVQYVGVNATDGEQFDSSWSRGAIPFRIIAGMSSVIDGWNEGLIGMKVGGERLLQIPSAMAYGEGDLVFRVHLEKRIEAPYAHTAEFGGTGPADVETTTIIEGSGDGAEVGDEIEANVAVLIHSSNELLQSSWEDGEPTGLFLQEGTLLPGLNEAIEGIKVGETRQIVLPTQLAYPDGYPAQLNVIDGDAIVFIIELLAINPG